MKDRIIEIAGLLKQNYITAIEAKGLLLALFDMHEDSGLLGCDICQMYTANNTSHGRMVDTHCPCCMAELPKLN